MKGMSTYITEQEQVDAIKAFFKKHSRLIALGLLVLLILLTGYRYFSWRHENIRLQASTLYDSLMNASAHQDTKQISAFSETLIQNYGTTIYADFARLILAKYEVESGNLDKAKVSLSAVLSTANSMTVRQIARIRLARILLSEKQQKKAMQILSIIDDKHYQSLVDELYGDIYLSLNDRDQAQAFYQKAKIAGEHQGRVSELLPFKLSALSL